MLAEDQREVWKKEGNILRRRSGDRASKGVKYHTKAKVGVIEGLLHLAREKQGSSSPCSVSPSCVGE